MQVSVIGSGAWGTALAKVLDENGHSITLWGRDPSLLKQIRNTGFNERHLPGKVSFVESRVSYLLQQGGVSTP